MCSCLSCGFPGPLLLEGCVLECLLFLCASPASQSVFFPAVLLLCFLGCCCGAAVLGAEVEAAGAAPMWVGSRSEWRHNVLDCSLRLSKVLDDEPMLADLADSGRGRLPRCMAARMHGASCRAFESVQVALAGKCFDPRTSLLALGRSKFAVWRDSLPNNFPSNETTPPIFLYNASCICGRCEWDRSY